ncbi:efflux RND transporter periplasmic adaptor subunit [Hymenobacter setariae]|uniref:Efflux RND transporter periplasmic adaptor subunit n=1 Tax=Hymenobacter setariae TaxID=2594794 RepID=A0A558C1E1_9BACT|nr:efflux RND transporter periplasmic adaptor subunit [Hymenobacter setariae]TVT42611.1 efflux RND transporter periplasmic adaptor subunit [Hymenobacter setariae]
MKNMLKPLALVVSISALAACGSKPDTAAKGGKPAGQASKSTAPAAPANPDQVAVSAAQMRAAGIELGSFERQNMTTEVQANGSVEVPPQNRVSITAIQGGYVQTVAVLPGEHVAAGATVATLRSPEYLTMQQQYLQSKAKVRFLTEDLERQRILDVEDVGAKRKLQQARADFATEQATLRATAAQLRLLGISVARLDATGQLQNSVPLTTPISGYVKAVNINPGQYVNPQDVLVEVLNRDDLHLELKVFEKDVAQVKLGQKILFRVQNVDRGEELTARVFLVGKAFDDNARTVRVHAHLEPERRDLLPGQFVAARIQTAGARVRTLPESALIQAGDLSYVFRRVGQDSGRTAFRRVRVRAGQPQHGDVAVTVLDPLPDTTQLVRRGAYFLDAELRKGADDE